MDGITLKHVEDIAPYSGPHEIPGIRFRHARQELGVTAWGMNVIELDPHNDHYPEHDHRKDGQEEVYFVVRGAAFLQAGDEELAVTAGQFVRVAPEVRRKWVTRDTGATLLALGGTPGEPYKEGYGG